MIARLLVGTFLILILPAPALVGQQAEVEEYVLDNGLKFLLVPRQGDPNVAAGWVAKVGSVNERPGITGISHLFEHMMFKGTHAIGSNDLKENLRVMQQMDRVKAQIFEEEQKLLDRWRLGEIEDLKDPANRSARHSKLLEEFQDLTRREKETIVKNEFDRIYTQGGGSSMNATTNRDYTLYFINVPSNKLELWFWMESDRLLNPVFREFYAERDVVYEERRLRIESTPIGRFREQFESMFWTSHPYGWPVIGWPSDVAGITREEALDFYDVNYAPGNLAVCLVGDFDPAQAKRLADRYFGRLKPGKRKQEPVRTLEVEQQAEKRMSAFADTNPQVEIRYHTVADGHVDEAPLSVMGQLLSGRTGRLYKSLVLEKKLANRVFGNQTGLKWAGYFTFGGTAKPGKDPLEVEQAIYGEIEKLRNQPVSERELQKVKNRAEANNFRRIENNFALMFQLLLAENSRGWKSFYDDPKKLQQVTPDDILRVANKYFSESNRAVAVYYTKPSNEPEDPILAGLSPAEKRQVKNIKKMIDQLPVDRANQFLSQLEREGLPEQMANIAPVLKKLVRERIKQLEGGQR